MVEKITPQEQLVRKKLHYADRHEIAVANEKIARILEELKEKGLRMEDLACDIDLKDGTIATACRIC